MDVSNINLAVRVTVLVSEVLIKLVVVVVVLVLLNEVLVDVTVDVFVTVLILARNLVALAPITLTAKEAEPFLVSVHAYKQNTINP